MSFCWPHAFLGCIQPNHVRQAAAEYDELSQDEFLTRYGFGRARAYLLIVDGKACDSKPFLASPTGTPPVSRLVLTTSAEALPVSARVLRDLGFEVRNVRDSAD